MTSRTSEISYDLSRLIVITDLDGTLLDFHSYSFDMAKPALRLLKRHKIPVVCCSSKTAEEIKYWRKKIRIDYPFICENGSAVYFPKDQFITIASKEDLLERDGYFVKELSVDNSRITSVLADIRSRLCESIVGFSDSELSTIRDMCGFTSIRDARRAANREYSEPFWFSKEVNEKTIRRVVKQLKAQGLNVIRGKRFFHVLGNSDKGKATLFVRRAYETLRGSNQTIVGIGDSTNDIEMLESVDIPVLVMGHNRRYNMTVRERISPVLAGAPGPEGWNRALTRLLMKATA